jgi:exodeoxyribonuclease V alpha subunit
MMLEPLQTLREVGLIDDLDRAFGCWVAKRDGEAVGLAAALASAEVAEGHVYLDLERAAARLREQRLERIEPPADWIKALARATTVAAPGARAPLVLDAERLYLHRYWTYETGIATRLRELARPLANVDQDALRKTLRDLFPARRAGELDRQALAVALGASRHLTILSGGPGTGKTTTVIKLLRLVRALEPESEVALAAPSGKAASRLAEALAQGWPAEAEPLATEPRTVHRLLGFNPATLRLHHDADNPLAADLVVVDEASMIDIGLMARLLAALKPAARLVLVGDRDQLASVEAGAVFGDICGVATGFPANEAERLEKALGATVPREEGEAAGVSASIALLKHNYRFKSGGIADLARAVIRDRPDAALAILRSGESGESGESGVWRPLADERSLRRAVVRIVKTHFTPVRRAASAEQALAELNRFRLLAAERRGAFGVEGLNAAVERALGIPAQANWYRGRPILITENDYELKLFNGDSGIVWPDADGRDKLWLRAADGRLKTVSVARLPAHETAWALTVHKAQGSEFSRIALVLPPRESRVATRELLYTGLTRARETVEVWATEPALRAAIARGIRRASGLAERLKAVARYD